MARLPTHLDAAPSHPKELLVTGCDWCLQTLLLAECMCSPDMLTTAFGHA